MMEPKDQPRPIPELLVEALEQLPAEDRRRVTAWVLARTSRQFGWMSREQAREQREWVVTGSPVSPPLRRLFAEQARHDPEAQQAARNALTARLLAGTQLKGEHQVVPVRLPAQLHTQLRDWCAEHGFSMATVMRGLLTQFLEGQQRTAGTPGLNLAEDEAEDEASE